MGSTAGKQKKRRVEKREGAPQVNSPKPDDIRRNGRRRGSKKEQAKRKKEQGKRKKEQAECKRNKVNENRRRERKKNALTGVESAEKRE